jgi:hypothetical protein
MLWLSKESSMTALETYRRELWASWRAVQEPILSVIEGARGAAELKKRCSDFDGGRTAAWMRGLGRSATWVSVRDLQSGSVAHVVSERSFRELLPEIRFGLRLLAWMSPRGITWYWWDQPWPRVLPAGVDPGRDHVNGGWAISGIREVHVYRREEAHKVLLHEAIHALELDVPAASVEPVRRQFEAALGRRLWPHLGEAFTELFAEWLWSIASAKTLRAARGRWAYQLECSEGQAAEVWNRIHDSRADEDTNVFAYYVLKWVLMLHAPATILAPDHSVRLWFMWWQASEPVLRRLAGAYSENREVRMGMTCGLS